MLLDLENEYRKILHNYGFNSLDTVAIYSILRNIFNSFLSESNKPAIYCNGYHTKILMSDFMPELRTVKILVDKNAKKDGQGFLVLRDEELDNSGVDLIIISSFKFRNEIKKNLQLYHTNIKILDIYDELEKKGYILKSAYYSTHSPYSSYEKINVLQRQIEINKNKKLFDTLYYDLVSEYLKIKDIKSALVKCKEWVLLSNSNKINALVEDLSNLYDMQLKAIYAINPRSILLLCMDAIIRK